MKVQKTISLSLALVAALSMGACSGSNNPAETASFTITVIDGYATGCTVTAGTLSGTATTEVGQYLVSVPDTTVPVPAISATGCTDSTTGLALPALSAPAVGTVSGTTSAPVITPATTMVQSLVKDGASASEALESVSKALGVSTENLTKDPVKLAEAGDTSALEANVKVMAIANAAQSLASSLGASASATDGVAAAIASLASGITTDGALPSTTKVMEEATKKVIETAKASGKLTEAAASVATASVNIEVNTIAKNVDTAVASTIKTQKAAIDAGTSVSKANGQALLGTQKLVDDSTKTTITKTVAKVETLSAEDLSSLEQATPDVAEDNVVAPPESSVQTEAEVQKAVDDAAEAAATDVANNEAAAAKANCDAVSGEFNATDNSCKVPVVTGSAS